MKPMTKLIHSNGMVTYCLPPNPKLQQELEDSRRRWHVQKIEDFIEGLDNRDACIALNVLLHNNKKSKKIRNIVARFFT